MEKVNSAGLENERKGYQLAWTDDLSSGWATVWGVSNKRLGPFGVHIFDSVVPAGVD